MWSPVAAFHVVDVPGIRRDALSGFAVPGHRHCLLINLLRPAWMNQHGRRLSSASPTPQADVVCGEGAVFVPDVAGLGVRGATYARACPGSRPRHGTGARLAFRPPAGPRPATAHARADTTMGLATTPPTPSTAS